MDSFVSVCVAKDNKKNKKPPNVASMVLLEKTIRGSMVGIVKKWLINPRRETSLNPRLPTLKKTDISLWWLAEFRRKSMGMTGGGIFFKGLTQHLSRLVLQEFHGADWLPVGKGWLVFVPTWCVG